MTHRMLLTEHWRKASADCPDNQTLIPSVWSAIVTLRSKYSSGGVEPFPYAEQPGF